MVIEVQESRDALTGEIQRRQRRTYTPRDPALIADNHLLCSSVS